MSISLKRAALTGAVALMALSVSDVAHASSKTVVQNSSEPNHQSIIQNIYGGSFAGSPESGFARGGPNPIQVTRANDLGGVILDLAGSNMGVGDDCVWHNGVISMSAKARFASYEQTFGFFPGESAAAAFVPLITVGGNGFGVTGEVAEFDIGAIAHTWRWGRAGTGSTFSSRPSDNPDGMDHMVSYKIEGLDNGFDATWLLFFEDLRADQNSDWDYNDLVIEINVRAGQPALVPLPTPANMALAGLASIAGMRRRRS